MEAEFCPRAHQKSRANAVSYVWAVVFYKWRGTESDVTLGLVLRASNSQEEPMTCISGRCPHGESAQIVKRGQTHCGTQRSLCQNTGCTSR